MRTEIENGPVPEVAHRVVLGLTEAEYRPLREILNREREVNPDCSVQDVIRSLMRRALMEDMPA
jgi:hypothetical protein